MGVASTFSSSAERRLRGLSLALGLRQSHAEQGQLGPNTHGPHLHLTYKGQ